MLELGRISKSLFSGSLGEGSVIGVVGVQSQWERE